MKMSEAEYEHFLSDCGEVPKSEIDPKLENEVRFVESVLNRMEWYRGALFVAYGLAVAERSNKDVVSYLERVLEIKAPQGFKK